MVCYVELLVLFTERYFSLICLFLCLYYLNFTYKSSSLEILKIIFCTLFNLPHTLLILLMQPTQECQENNKIYAANVRIILHILQQYLPMFSPTDNKLLRHNVLLDLL
jgi:hypothetical protein